MKNISYCCLLLLLLIFQSVALATENYVVDESIDDQIFIINGTKFTAQDVCLNVKPGDEVYFTQIGQRDPFNGCAEAEFINLSNQELCNVWCE